MNVGLRCLSWEMGLKSSPQIAKYGILRVSPIVKCIAIKSVKVSSITVRGVIVVISFFLFS